MSFVIKRMQPGDEAIFDDVAPDVFDEDIVAARLRACLAEPSHLMVLALEAGTVVGQCRGMLHRNPDEPSQLYVDNLGVTPSHQRRGVARALMAELCGWGRERGCKGGWVATELDNDAANAFYAAIVPKSGTRMIYYEFEL